MSSCEDLYTESSLDGSVSGPSEYYFYAEPYLDGNVSDSTDYHYSYTEPSLNGSVSDSFHYPSPPSVDIITDKRVDDLLSMTLKGRTTSVLNKLEEHRQTLDLEVYQSILLSLTAQWNFSSWSLQKGKAETKFYGRRGWQGAVRDPIEQCILTVFYYIVSIMNKHQLTIADDIWIQLLWNSAARNMPFYDFLYRNKIRIPEVACTALLEGCDKFYETQSSADKKKLIILGFRFPLQVKSRRNDFTLIKHSEQLFTELKRHNVSRESLRPEQMIGSMQTPEQLSLFLSNFPDYDLNSVNPLTNDNVLEQIIHMQPYFHRARERNPNDPVVLWRHRRSRAGAMRDGENRMFRPNDRMAYRTARLLNVFRAVVLRGGQLSKPLSTYLVPESRTKFSFLRTSIGLYALIGLRMDDIYPCDSPRERDQRFVLDMIQFTRGFAPECIEFLLYRLASSYSIVHDKDFVREQRSTTDIERQETNDLLFRRTLTLKEWCRLKIKDACPQRQIQKLDLSQSLKEYCSFDLLHSNYASRCIKEVTCRNGRLMPNNPPVEISSSSSDNDV